MTRVASIGRASLYHRPGDEDGTTACGRGGVAPIDGEAVVAAGLSPCPTCYEHLPTPGTLEAAWRTCQRWDADYNRRAGVSYHPLESM